jgi:hypothetical protein
MRNVKKSWETRQRQILIKRPDSLRPNSDTVVFKHTAMRLGVNNPNGWSAEQFSPVLLRIEHLHRSASLTVICEPRRRDTIAILLPSPKSTRAVQRVSFARESLTPLTISSEIAAYTFGHDSWNSSYSSPFRKVNSILHSSALSRVPTARGVKMSTTLLPIRTCSRRM